MSAPYGVLKTGDRSWYVQALKPDGDLAAGNIVAISFATRKGATAAAAARNEIRGYEGPVPVRVQP